MFCCFALLFCFTDRNVGALVTLYKSYYNFGLSRLLSPITQKDSVYKVPERESRSTLGLAYGRRVSERAVAGALCSSLRCSYFGSPSPAIPDRLV